MKDLILPIGSNSETRLVVKVYNDGSVQLSGLLSVKEMAMLGEAIIKASKLLVLA